MIDDKGSLPRRPTKTKLFEAKKRRYGCSTPLHRHEILKLYPIRYPELLTRNDS